MAPPAQRGRNCDSQPAGYLHFLPVAFAPRGQFFGGPAALFQFGGQPPLGPRLIGLLLLGPAMVPAHLGLHLRQQFLAEFWVAQAPAALDALPLARLVAANWVPPFLFCLNVTSGCQTGERKNRKSRALRPLATNRLLKSDY